MTVWGRKIILLFIFGGVLPLSAFGAAADFDNSLTVDFNDLKLFTNYWLYDYNDNERCAYWDLAANGQIDFYDLSAFANHWLDDYDFGDFSGFGQYWRRTVDYRFQDARFDLTGDGFVDLKDFSSFASEWMTTCCDDNSVSVDGIHIANWQYITFTGIGPCGETECWWNPGWSDPCVDRCDRYVYQTCQETAELGSYCAYNYWYIAQRVGLCVYHCGRNGFWILKNNGGCRILFTRHLTRDIPPQDPECYPWGCDDCDEQDIDYYNWQSVITNLRDLNHIELNGGCYYAYSFDIEIGYGGFGSCKIIWWPH